MIHLILYIWNYLMHVLYDKKDVKQKMIIKNL